MPVNKVRRLGSFAPLSASAWTDDALAEAGEAAELLFYRTLSFSAHVLRDGFVTDSQLIRMVGHGMKDAKKRADRLCAVGLWVKADNGYWVRSWLKWNRSREEIETLQRKDAGRKSQSARTPDVDSGPDGSDSDRNPNGVQSDSESDALFNQDGFPPRARHTEPHTEPEPEPKPSGSGRKRPARALPDAWQPNDNHRAYAAEHNINLPHEAEQFRQHARANDRRQVDWDAAFRTWLGNRVSWARPSQNQAPGLSRFVEQ